MNTSDAEKNKQKDLLLHAYDKSKSSLQIPTKKSNGSLRPFELNAIRDTIINAPFESKVKSKLTKEELKEIIKLFNENKLDEVGNKIYEYLRSYKFNMGIIYPIIDRQAFMEELMSTPILENIDKRLKTLSDIIDKINTRQGESIGDGQSTIRCEIRDPYREIEVELLLQFIVRIKYKPYAKLNDDNFRGLIKDLNEYNEPEITTPSLPQTTTTRFAPQP